MTDEKNIIKNKKSQNTGSKGEDLVCIALEDRGHKIIARNFRAERCEIDIITLHCGYIIFTEVKTRTSTHFGRAAESVNIKKQENIIKAAKNFIYKSEGIYEKFQPRFDVAEVYIDEKTNRSDINIIEFAFIT